MTYGVYSYFHPVLGERPWVVSLQTGPALVERAIAAVVRRKPTGFGRTE